MTYTTFNQEQFNAIKEPMFFGRNVNVSRYDVQKHPVFEKLIEKQLSFFWRPEEVDLSTDRRDFAALPDHEKHIFLSNLKYQTLLDLSLIHICYEPHNKFSAGPNFKRRKSGTSQAI